MGEPVSEASDEQIQGEGGETTTGVTLPEEDETDVPPAPAADSAVEEPVADEPAVDEPAAEEPVVVEEPTGDVDPTTEAHINDSEVDAKGDTYATLTITANSNWKITEVKKDGADTGESNGTYTVTANATVTVKTVATYSASVSSEISNAKITVTTSDATSTTQAQTQDIIVGGDAVPLEKGKAMKFEVTANLANNDSRLKVYYITDGSADSNDRTEITPVKSGTGDTTTTTYTVEQEVIDSLDSSIEIVLVG